MTQGISPKRGEVWRVVLDPVIGSEIAKTRPVVVLSLPGIGRPSVRLGVPVTDFNEAASWFFWRVTLAPSGGLSKVSSADASQIRSLDVSRFQERLGKLEVREVDAIAEALAKIVGYSP